MYIYGERERGERGGRERRGGGEEMERERDTFTHHTREFIDNCSSSR